jgi:hypothetical protein
MRILEILCPVFAAYLGSAGRSIGKSPIDTAEEFSDPSLGALIVKGPFWLFSVCSVALIVAFWMSNSSSEVREGMSIDTFAGAFALILAFLTGTTHFVVEHLFSLTMKK